MRRGAFALVCLVGFAGLFSALTFCGAAAGQAPQFPRATYPGKDWSLEFQLPGFVMQTGQMMRNDTQYIQAENLTDEVWVAMSMEKLTKGEPSQNCADRLDRQVKYLKEQVKLEDVSATEMNSIPVREFMLHTFMGRKVEQKRLIGCMIKDDIFVGVEVWKLEYQPADERLLLDAMNSLQVVKAEKRGFAISGAAPTDSGVARDSRAGAELNAAKVAGQASGEAVAPAAGQAGQTGNGKTSAYYFALGTQYYVNRDYTGAIRAYRKAFDSEKENRQLSRSFWIVLVDNLGTAYAEEKNLDRAEEIFKYGVSKEPDYPTFYYNLGCVYALRGDMNATMDYLRKAWARKANTLQGEEMPDPTKDDSLVDFMADPEFSKFANGLAAQRN